MRIIKKTFGKIIYFIGWVIEFILNLTIGIMEMVTRLVKGIGRSLLIMYTGVKTLLFNS